MHKEKTMVSYCHIGDSPGLMFHWYAHFFLVTWKASLFILLGVRNKYAFCGILFFQCRVFIC